MPLSNLNSACAKSPVEQLSKENFHHPLHSHFSVRIEDSVGWHRVSARRMQTTLNVWAFIEANFIHLKMHGQTNWNMNNNGQSINLIRFARKTRKKIWILCAVEHRETNRNVFYSLWICNSATTRTTEQATCRCGHAQPLSHINNHKWSPWDASGAFGLARHSTLFRSDSQEETSKSMTFEMFHTNSRPALESRPTVQSRMKPAFHPSLPLKHGHCLSIVHSAT